MEMFSIKIGKFNVELELTFGNSCWNLYCKNSEIDFFGNVYNGHLNYNNTGIVMYCDAKEFTFFKDEISQKIVRILKKNKIITK